MPNNSNEDMQKATSLHQNGQLEKAEEIYKKVLRNNPSQSDAQYLIGVIALQKNNHHKAIELFEKAILIKPKAYYYYDCAQAYNVLTDKESAISSYKKAIALKDDYLEANNNVGNILREIGNREEAIQYFKKTIQINDKFSIGYYNLALTYDEKKDYDNAVSFYKKTIEINPNFAQAYNNLGVILKKKSAFKDAIYNFEKAININPKYTDAYFNLGSLYYQFGDTLEGHTEKAINCFEKIIAINPSHLKVYNKLSRIMRHLNKQDEAIHILEKALEINANDPETHNNIGLAYTELGQSEKAIKSFEKAIKSFENVLKIKDDYYPAIYNLTLVDPNKKYHPKIKKYLTNKNIDKNDKILLLFASARIHGKEKNYDEEFYQYKNANNIKRKDIPYQSKLHSNYIDQLVKYYSRDRLNEIGNYSTASNLPIFIVGMTRSGTSLIEQIISSHPDIYGAGELTLIQDFERKLVNYFIKNNLSEYSITSIDNAEIKIMLDQYINALKRYMHSETHITDKQPYNYLKIGLIKSLLPNSKIIYCKRNPLDVCISIFFQNFPAYSHDTPLDLARKNDKKNNNHNWGLNAFSFDLKDIGKYYLDHERIMDHWKNIYQDEIYEIQYEELVNNQEKKSKELIDFIGLKWDPNCLDFYKNKREVKTSSNFQVRKPMYSNSIERWKKYEKHVKSLINILNYRE